ncbi:MAG: hypothetical protein WCL50_00375 [Spirochaetota bacterium]
MERAISAQAAVGNSSNCLDCHSKDGKSLGEPNAVYTIELRMDSIQACDPKADVSNRPYAIVLIEKIGRWIALPDFLLLGKVLRGSALEDSLSFLGHMLIFMKASIPSISIFFAPLVTLLIRTSTQISL